MTDIGRAGMVMKGNYNSASTYETLDVVSDNNGLYVAKQNVPAGIAPTNTTYWQSAVNVAAAPVSIPLTYNTGVEFASGGAYKVFDKIVICQLKVSLNNFTDGLAITGLPHVKGHPNNDTDAIIIKQDNGIIAVEGNGNIYLVNIESTALLDFCYLTD